jgi:hypothetical protein
MAKDIDQCDFDRVVSVITEVLAKYDYKVDHAKAIEFSERFARERDSIKEISTFLGKVSTSFDAIDTIHENHHSLSHSQSQSISKLAWLRSTIMNITSVKDIQKVNEIVLEVQKV